MKLKSNFEKSFNLYLDHLEVGEEIRILKRHLKKQGKYSDQFTKELRQMYRLAKHGARHVNLVRGFIKGLDYKTIENNSKTEPSLDYVWTLLKAEGIYVPRETVEAWANGGV